MAAELSLDGVQRKCLVSGFLRDAQGLFPQNSIAHIIPPLVNAGVLRFYNALYPNRLDTRAAMQLFLTSKIGLDLLFDSLDKENKVCVYDLYTVCAFLPCDITKGFIDEQDLEDLVYCALCIFCAERDRDMPEPPREQLEPFVKKIIMELKPMLDEDADGVISRDGIDLFGKYLETEYDKLLQEVAKSDKGEVNDDEEEQEVLVAAKEQQIDKSQNARK